MGPSLAGLLFYGTILVLNSSLSGLCMLKGKFVLGGITAIIGGPYFNTCGAIRLAKPDSWWAQRYYGPAKLERARARSAWRSRHSARALRAALDRRA